MGEVLISGGSRGLGAGLIKLFRAEKLDRENINEFKTKTYSTLIHAAFERYIPGTFDEKYIIAAEDLVSKILDLNYTRFVLISSVDCNDPRNLGTYTVAKRSVEKKVREHCQNHLILRLPSLYGSEMKHNQVYKIATEKNPQLTLSPNSTLSLLSYEDVYEFIINSQASGTISLISDILKLGQLAEYFEADPSWGNFDYQTVMGQEKFVAYDAGTSLTKYAAFISRVVGTTHESI